MNRALIGGDVQVEETFEPVNTIWAHDPDDPLVIRVHFVGHGATWQFSLDLFKEAFTPPFDGIFGFGDVQIEVNGRCSFLHLTNGVHSASVRFITDEILIFLDQIDDQDAEEVISRELDEFLSQL